MPWVSEFLWTIDCIVAGFIKGFVHDVYQIDGLQTFAFFAKQCGHAASCPLHSDTPAEHSALSAFPASPALPSFCPVISIIKTGRCCMTSSRGPRSAMPQRMNLNEIVQEATVSCTIGCFVPQEQSPKWGQLNQNLCFCILRW